MSKKVCFCIVGKSGVGKSYIADKLTKEHSFVQVDSYTTRPRRDNECSGHIFITEEEANNWPKEDIVAYGIYGGYQYFATRDQIDNSDVYVVDKQGLKGLKNDYEGKEGTRALVIVELKTGFFNRMKRLIRAQGFVKGIKRALRDIGKFRGLRKFEPLVLRNDLPEDADFIVSILAVSKQATESFQ